MIHEYLLDRAGGKVADTITCLPQGGYTAERFDIDGGMMLWPFLPPVSVGRASMKAIVQHPLS